MRIFEWKRFVPAMLVGLSLCCGGAVRAFAEDDGKDSPPTKPVAAAKIEAPAPLTERERLLLDRVEQLEKRVADLEGKGNPGAASGADAAAEQPASTTPVASTAGVAAPGTTSGVKPTSPDFLSKNTTAAVGPQATEKGKIGRGEAWEGGAVCICRFHMA